MKPVFRAFTIISCCLVHAGANFVHAETKRVYPAVSEAAAHTKAKKPPLLR